MTLETELRFGDNVANLLQRLSKVKQLVSTICNRQMDFAEIDDYLRGRHAKCALITLVSWLVSEIFVQTNQKTFVVIGYYLCSLKGST